MLLLLKENKYNYLLIAIISGLLFWLGWPVNPFPFFLFFSFVPLFIIEEQISKSALKNKGWHFFAYCYLAFFIWNTSTTWWVYNSTKVGATIMLLANALLMCLPLMLFRITKKFAGPGWGFFGFVLYWLTFEYIHLSWDLSWPWLTLGNAFAMIPEAVQWYEHTGVFGGSLYILLANLIFYFLYLNYSRSTDKKPVIINLVFAAILLLIPVIYSLIRYSNYEEVGRDVSVVVLQPNIDPYTEKFVNSENFIPYEEQARTFMDLSALHLDAETDFLVWPETAIDNVFDEHQINEYNIIQKIRKFKSNFPKLSLLTGITSYNRYKSKALATASARFRADLGYYDVFNTAFFLSDASSYDFYHKSKLVPGVEIMPYPQFFQFLSEKTIELGGTSGSLGRQKDKTAFFNSDSIGVAPSICYESIYGAHMAEFIRNGADLIFIITNDGWWGNTPGHKQHFHYARLRAVETRRAIARSANTGISGIINQRGDVLKATEYWTQDVIKKNVKANKILTAYARHGDYLARTTAWLSVIVFLSAFVKRKIYKP